MQGRLLNKYKKQFQSHPVGYWQKEFLLAEKLNMDYIEFIYDFDEFEKNPLSNLSGLNEVLKLSKKHKIKIRSICADIFMQKPIYDKDNFYLYENIIFENLFKACKFLQVEDLVIPLVDNSSIKKCKNQKFLIDQLRKLCGTFDSLNTNICLETDLEPSQFLEFIDKIKNKKIRINYDIGNSISNGFDPSLEFNTYYNLISLIHIKDRKFNGPSVFAGSGDVNFDLFFELIKKINYNKNITFQLYRNENGLDSFIKQLKWIKTFTKFSTLIKNEK